ncbi:hypothetical protein EB796_002374 [Bugula neritina]|uniref:Caspase family p10 domain-containing protein n=1 Tax=Bugula neritina TaxID=10212 RepID=A0A7J7KMD7_BUGNE|nr:hypothetical protein EB796_002374 [Bugula neritina]
MYVLAHLLCEHFNDEPFFKDRTGGISSDVSMNPDVKPPQADDDVVHLPASSSTHSHHKLVYDDLLVVKASVESFVSWRHPVYGSLMIRALVSSMYKHAGHHDLCAIFKQVQAKVRNLCVKRNFGHGQLVIAWDTLTNMRKLYLFPGL